MTILQDFKQMFVVGEKVGSRLPAGNESERKVLVVRATMVGLENPREGVQGTSWLDFPKASQLSKRGDRFVITYDDGITMEYWKPQAGE